MDEIETIYREMHVAWLSNDERRALHILKTALGDAGHDANERAIALRNHVERLKAKLRGQG